jgi:hypothetical protein
MNKHCHGDWYPALNAYRCLWDGTFRTCDKIPKECPVCERKTSNVTTHKKIRIRLKTIVEVLWRDSVNPDYVEFVRLSSPKYEELNTLPK